MRIYTDVTKRMKETEALYILSLLESVCRREHMDTEGDAIVYGMIAIKKDSIEVDKWYERGEDAYGNPLLWEGKQP